MHVEHEHGHEHTSIHFDMLYDCYILSYDHFVHWNWCDHMAHLLTLYGIFSIQFDQFHWRSNCSIYIYMSMSHSHIWNNCDCYRHEQMKTKLLMMMIRRWIGVLWIWIHSVPVLSLSLSLFLVGLFSWVNGSRLATANIVIDFTPHIAMLSSSYRHHAIIIIVIIDLGIFFITCT